MAAFKMDMSLRSYDHCPHVLSLLCTLKDVTSKRYLCSSVVKKTTPPTHTHRDEYFVRFATCFAHLSFKSVNIFLDTTLSLCFKATQLFIYALKEFTCFHTLTSTYVNVFM